VNDHKKLPPFGKQLLNKPRNRREAKQDIHIFVGVNCWNIAKQYKDRDCLAFSLNENPDNFNWQVVVKNREILLWLTSNATHEQLRHLSYVLLREGALIVRIISMVYWQMVAVYRRNKGGNGYGH
jgi:hypothetical protein